MLYTASCLLATLSVQLAPSNSRPWVVVAFGRVNKISNSDTSNHFHANLPNDADKINVYKKNLSQLLFPTLGIRQLISLFIAKKICE